LPAAFRDDADLSIASKIPAVSIGCVLAHKIVTSSIYNRRG
jgi:hypothetical protein